MAPLWKFTGSYVLDVKAGPVEINGQGPIRGEFCKFSLNKIYIINRRYSFF